MRIRFTAHAVVDLERAHDYYAQIDPELGERFLADVDAAVERLEMFPAGAPPVEGFDEMRRARMRHLPYGVFYRCSDTETELLVIRVLHSRRHHPDILEHPGS
ncbi:type II toxin-antitoxin system RelE/ParE family toxin [Georgenia sunbinii]|uniref:type II toxin-antitoxin system RelE/ParE family toxin n=1 Tax=Georgenia sunbinii TaxID=3117728 RepID=UPI002F2664BA